MCMRFRIYSSNILQSNTLCTSDLHVFTCAWLCSGVSFGVAETKDDLIVYLIHYCAICSRANVC